MSGGFDESPFVSGIERILSNMDSIKTALAAPQQVCPGVWRLLELEEGLWIAQARVDALKEQDINAHYMQPAMFAALVQNIKKWRRLESLPYCVYVPGEEPPGEVQIVSGHHRVRAARAAQKGEVFIILDCQPLTRSQIVAKQLAHNAINGQDDPDVLQELGRQMTDPDDVLESYVGEAIAPLPDPEFKAPPVLAPRADIAWHTLSLAFLPHQVQDLADLVAAVKEQKPELVGAQSVELFKPFVDALARYGKAFDVINTSTVVALLIRTALEQVRPIEQEDDSAERAEAGEEPERWVPLANVVGRARVPADAAKIIKLALDRVAERAELMPSNRWQGLELICADWLGGN